MGGTTASMGPSLGERLWLELYKAEKNRIDFYNVSRAKLEKKENRLMQIIVDDIEYNLIDSEPSQDYEISFDFGKLSDFGHHWKCHADITDFNQGYSAPRFKLKSFSMEKNDGSPLVKELLESATLIAQTLKSKHYQCLEGPKLILSDDPEYIKLTGSWMEGTSRISEEESKLDFLLTYDKFVLEAGNAKRYYGDWIQLIDVMESTVYSRSRER